MFIVFFVIDEVGVVKVLFIDLKTSFFSADGFLVISLGGFYMYVGKGMKYP